MFSHDAEFLDLQPAEVRNARATDREFSVPKNGFQYAPLVGPPEIDYLDDDQVKNTYFPGLEKLVKEQYIHIHLNRRRGVLAKIAYFYNSRMMARGQEDTTELIGTGGKLTVNGNPQANFVNYYGPQGITREVPAHYYGRFEYAFVQEANEFTAAALYSTRLPLKLTNAVKAVQIGSYLQEALETGKKLYFDETGRRVDKQAKLQMILD